MVMQMMILLKVKINMKRTMLKMEKEDDKEKMMLMKKLLQLLQTHYPQIRIRGTYI